MHHNVLYSVTACFKEGARRQEGELSTMRSTVEVVEANDVSGRGGDQDRRLGNDGECECEREERLS